MADPIEFQKLGDLQKLSQENMSRALSFFGGWTKSWQAIAAEMSDYSKRSIENNTRTLEKLMSARSFDQALEIQTNYARTAYDDYMREMNKLGGMYASMAKDAYKPIESVFPVAR